MSIWDKDKTAWLKENYPNNGSEYCSNYLGVSRSSVMHEAVRLGTRLLTKNAGYCPAFLFDI